MNNRHLRHVGFLCLGMFFIAASASAQSHNTSTFVVGAGIGGAPEYLGADRFRAFPVIFADYQRADGWFVSVTRGLGYTATEGPLNFSAALGYDGGRDDSKRTFGNGSDDLRGMGKIKGAALAKLHAGYNFGFVTVTADADLALSDRDRGNTFQFGASAPLLRNQVNQITAGLTTRYRDDDSMQTWYGVSPLQSVRSGYQAYRTEGGFENVSASLNLNHIIDRSWSINTTVGVARLLNDAADSPLTKRKNSPLLIGMVNYRF